MKSEAIKDHISIGSKVSPNQLRLRVKIDAKYPDIYLRENDKLNYLSTYLSSTELIGKHPDQLCTVVIPKSRYQYR